MRFRRLTPLCLARWIAAFFKFLPRSASEASSASERITSFPTVFISYVIIGRTARPMDESKSPRPHPAEIVFQNNKAYPFRLQ